MTKCPHRDECWMAFLNYWRKHGPDKPKACWHEEHGGIADCVNYAIFEREAAGEPVEYYAVEVM